MHTKKILLAATLTAAFLPTLAAAQSPQVSVTSERLVRGPGTVTVKPGQPGPGKIIKNAPYSAEGVTEKQQTLADGNQIASKQSTMSYRDSAGRTRLEYQDAKGELKAVTIQDPVAGATYLLNPQQKSAIKVVTGESARTRIEQLRKEGKLPGVDKDGKHEIIVKQVERAKIQETVRIQVDGDAPVTPGDMSMRIPPILAGALGDRAWAVKATTKDLGSKEIEGVKANGKLRSYEIPAGEVGNRHAIVVTNESWYAPELQVTIYTKHTDPRSGERVYRLAGLKRDEPAAALFTVPADYTVK